MFHQFKCPDLYKDKLAEEADPGMKLWWYNHESMLKSILNAQRGWSVMEEDENGILVKELNIQALKLFGKKIEYLARICSARINGLLD